LAAGASASVAGWLVGAAQLVLAFCYLKVPDFVGAVGSRKRAILILVLFDVLTLLPFIVLPYFVTDGLVQIVLVFSVISLVPNIVVGPIWASWMTDLVPAGIRGRYLGWRSTVYGASELACFVMAAIVLNAFAKGDFAGFSIIFIFAAISRLVAWIQFWKMHDVPMPVNDGPTHLGVRDIKDAISSPSIGRFMIYSASFSFAFYLAAPFFAVFMLTELGFSYLTFMLVLCAEQLARLLVMRFWGKYADAHGNLRVIRYVSVVLPFTPVLWLVSQNIVYLVAVQVIAGVAWAGFELCSPNFIYGAAPSGSRIKHIALFRSFNGAATGAGALVGGFLVILLPPLFGHSMLTLFLLSGIIRAAVVVAMLPSLVEVSQSRGFGTHTSFQLQRGLLQGDAVSDGFGWGLLHIPAALRGNLRGNVGGHATFGVKKQADNKPSGMFYNRAWQMLRRRIRARDDSNFVMAREKLVREGLIHSAEIRNQPVKATPNDVGDRSGTIKLEERAKVVGHSGLAKHAAARSRAGSEPPTQEAGRALEGLLKAGDVRLRFVFAQKSAKHIVDRVEKSNTYRGGLLNNTDAWQAYMKRIVVAGVQPEVKFKSRPLPRREGLLHRPDLAAKLGGVLSNVSSGIMTNATIRRLGLLHNTEAWRGFQQTSGIRPAQDASGTLQLTWQTAQFLRGGQVTVNKPVAQWNPSNHSMAGGLESKPYRSGLVNWPEAWRRHFASPVKNAASGVSTPVAPPYSQGLLYFKERRPAFVG
jgi:MFS family permease